MSDNQPEGDLGFPQNTPLAEMDDKQQLAYWKHQSRKHENASKTYKQQLDARPTEGTKPEAKDDSKDDKPKEQPFDIAAFKADLKKELRLEEAPGKVREAFVNAIGSRMEAAALGEFLDDLNLQKFVKDDGSIDTAKITARAEALAPKPTPRSHLGERRATSNKATSVKTGRELFDAWFPSLVP